MNNIATKQNEQKQLERLAAQRELYSSAKNLHGFQIILTVAIPLILAILATLIKEVSVAAAIFGFFAFIIDISFIEPVIKTKKIKAAKIQELFDCDVLQLSKSPLKTVDDITVEEVLRHYNAHAKIKTNIERIKNWYPTNMGNLPIHIARIICQRTNCWWDSKLREKYSKFLKIISASVFGILVLIGILSNLTLIRITLIASSLVPFFRFCIKQCNDNQDAAKKLTTLVLFSKALWEKALTQLHPEETISIDSRRLQDEIFDHRSRSPLILNLYYGLFRDESEVLMNRTSDILVEEANEALINQ